jgi:hypothetical protein
MKRGKGYFWCGAMKKQPVGKFRTKEEWRVVRAMVEVEGMTLTAAAEKASIPYSTVQGRARIECWNPPWGIIRGRPRDTEIMAAQAKKIEANLAREEVLLMAEASLVKAQDLDLLAAKSLVVDSARLKVAISRRVREIVERLADPTIPVRSAAQALGTLAPILRLLYRWDCEPDLQGMKRAVTSCYEADIPEELPPTGAVNLRLIATTPEQLAAMAKEKGVFATECNGQGVGPCVIAPEQPPAAIHGPPIPEKEAPKPPQEGQSVEVTPAGHPPGSEKPKKPPDWSERINYPAPLSQTPFGHSPQDSFDHRSSR